MDVFDEHIREALAIVVDRNIDADRTVATLEGLVAQRNVAPGFIRCDNGPELTANAIRDWGRFEGDRRQLHRTRCPVGEPVRGVLRRPTPG